MMQYLFMFLAAAFIDLSYVHWFRAVHNQQYLRAALFSMVIGACGILGVTGVVADGWLAVPWLAGLGVGTIVGMKFK